MSEGGEWEVVRASERLKEGGYVVSERENFPQGKIPLQTTRSLPEHVRTSLLPTCVVIDVALREDGSLEDAHQGRLHETHPPIHLLRGQLTHTP